MRDYDSGSNGSAFYQRGLVLEGGGIRGAYTLGCLQAFKDKGITFNAVSGVSSGSLNAALFATDQVERGRQAWRGVGFSQIAVFRRVLVLPAALLVALGDFIDDLIENNATELLSARVQKLILFAIIAAIVVVGILAPQKDWFTLLFIIACITFSPSGRRQFTYHTLLWTVGMGLFLIAWGLWKWRFTETVVGIGFLMPCALTVLYYHCRKWASILETPAIEAFIGDLAKADWKIPAYIVTADRMPVWDFDAQPIRDDGPTAASCTTPETYERWVPFYHELSETIFDDRARILRASIALPYGIFRPAEGFAFLKDGGLADCLPLLPLVWNNETEEVFVVMLSNQKYDLANHVERTWRTRLSADATAELNERLGDCPSSEDLPIREIGANIKLEMIDGARRFSWPKRVRVIQMKPKSQGFLKSIFRTSRYIDDLFTMGYTDTLCELRKAECDLGRDVDVDRSSEGSNG